MTPTNTDTTRSSKPVVSVVIPCFKVTAKIGAVLERIGPEVDKIYCVDDACPDGSGRLITERFGESDPRITVIFRDANGGVGAATMTGYAASLADGVDVIVKLDGDGQMDPRLIPQLIAPIVAGESDYVKGNRFYDLESVRQMSVSRIIGNAGLSFLTKLSSGYWDLFDPTNGFTAIEARVAAAVPMEKLHRRYFFETDMLFRLNTIRARVIEIPMVGIYGDEVSNLSELHALVTHPFLHARNLLKRVAYSYFLRGFSVASVNLVLGLALIVFGAAYGVWHWSESSATGTFASPGTVMLSALPILLGLQLLLNFLSLDMAMTPKEAIHRRMSAVERDKPTRLAGTTTENPTRSL